MLPSLWPLLSLSLNNIGNAKTVVQLIVSICWWFWPTWIPSWLKPLTLRAPLKPRKSKFNSVWIKFFHNFFLKAIRSVIGHCWRAKHWPDSSLCCRTMLLSARLHGSFMRGLRHWIHSFRTGRLFGTLWALQLQRSFQRMWPRLWCLHELSWPYHRWRMWTLRSRIHWRCHTRYFQWLPTWWWAPTHLFLRSSWISSSWLPRRTFLFLQGMMRNQNEWMFRTRCLIRFLFLNE